MTYLEKWPGRIALMVAHCAGMVDLVALPVWVGTLIAAYNFDPQEAGGLVTLFLASAVMASITFAPHLNKFNARVVATLGFSGACLAFGMVSTQSDFMSMAFGHAIAGFSAGTALSFTHGTIGQSRNPHRLFAMVGFAIGVFAIIFLGAAPNLIDTFGGAVLFQLFAGLMGVSTVVCLLMFPVAPSNADKVPDIVHQKFSKAIWACIIGISLMALNQAMIFSFFERIGMDRAYSIGMVTSVLIAMGFVNLIPAPLAAFLETRINAHKVVIVGPIAQVLLALMITLVPSFNFYAAAGALFVSIMIFTHTFAFGLLSRLDTSGRAVATTPAMLMVGAAIGPLLGGTLVKFYDFSALGFTACIISVLAVIAFRVVLLEEIVRQGK